jgi:O-6-methylguanine DNA methyltransferase
MSGVRRPRSDVRAGRPTSDVRAGRPTSDVRAGRPTSDVRAGRPTSEVLCRASYATPIGELLLLASARGLCGLEFVKPGGHRWLDRRLTRWFAPYQIVDEGEAEPSRSLDAARHWLEVYFKDPRQARTDAVPLDMRGAPFERRVWRALLDVPCGSTSSYGTIARAVGAPDAARAVGAANGANPVSLIVPCHRIIGSNGSLTGYGGGLHRKEWLLKHEGARLF